MTGLMLLMMLIENNLTWWSKNVSIYKEKPLGVLKISIHVLLKCKTNGDIGIVHKLNKLNVNVSIVTHVIVIHVKELYHVKKLILMLMKCSLLSTPTETWNSIVMITFLKLYGLNSFNVMKTTIKSLINVNYITVLLDIKMN